MMSWIKRNWLLSIILILALFFRLYRIDATMTFLEDEGRDLLIVNRMIDTGRPVLLGPQTSTGNMYLGPLYYYFITPALFLAGMDPLGPAILIAITGVLTTYLLYCLGKWWFSPVSGFIAAGMFAFLPFSLSVTRASWNPNLVPLIATFMLMIFDHLIYRKHTWYHWLLYGMSIGVLVQLHYMALIFAGVMSLLIVWLKRRDLAQLGKGIALAIVGAVIMLLPFIAFEIRNDWVNTRAITRFLEAKEERNIRYDLPAWLWWDKVSKTSYRLIARSLTGSEFASPKNDFVVATFIATVLAGLLIGIKQKNQKYLSIVTMLLSSLAVLGIYQENIHLHYIEFALPLLFLTLAGLYGVNKSLILQKVLLLYTIFIVIVGVASSWGYLNSGANHQLKKAKDVANYIVEKSGGEAYNVVSTQGMYTTPFQYFLAISSHPPSNALAKRIFDICEGSPCPVDDETTTLLFLTGPGHPSISNYLGHPEMNSFDAKRRIVSNEHVSVGIWVAEIVLE